MPMTVNRRAFTAGVLASLPLGLPARAAASPIELDWDDLIPEESKGLLFRSLQGLGVVQHGEFSSPFDQQAASAVVTDYDGKVVRIPGFVVPLDFTGMGVTTLILVPYVGACIHVPPPPANQLVFVQTKAPYVVESMWDPVFATGTFGTLAVNTELAEIGYKMKEAEIEPYTY